MTHSPLTSDIRLSSQCSPRHGRKIDRFIVHHAASTSHDGVVSMMVNRTREVSANYVVSDRRVTCVVDEDLRAWTSGSASWDGRAVTVETINSRAGDPWPVADRTFDNLARLIADVARRYGFPIDDDHVLTHQELWTRFRASYPTACPGDLQRRKNELLALANQYLAGRAAGSGAPAKPTAKPPTTSKGQSVPSREQWRTIQDWLRRLGRYKGPVDGVPGINTWKGIQITVRRYGYYHGPVDGVPGPNTYRGMQMYARDGGGYRGPIDGVLGPNSWAGFVRRLSS